MKHYHIFYQTLRGKFGRATHSGSINGPKDLEEIEKWLQDHFGGAKVVVVCWQPFGKLSIITQWLQKCKKGWREAWS